MTSENDRWDLLAHHIGPATLRAGRSSAPQTSAGVALAILIAFGILGFCAGLLWL